MKLANSSTMFRILFTEDDFRMIGTSQIKVKFRLDGVDKFIDIYKVSHPHADGIEVSIAPLKDGSITHVAQAVMHKGKGGGKWKHLKNLPFFSPETVVLTDVDMHGHWAVSRPAMTTVAPQANRKKKVEPTTPVLSKDWSEVFQKQPETFLPKVAPQIMTKEDFSETAMYKSLRDGLSLINKAKAFFGGRLVIEERDGKLVGLVEVTGD